MLTKSVSARVSGMSQPDAEVCAGSSERRRSFSVSSSEMMESRSSAVEPALASGLLPAGEA